MSTIIYYMMILQQLLWTHVDARWFYSMWADPPINASVAQQRCIHNIGGRYLASAHSISEWKNVNNNCQV